MTLDTLPLLFIAAGLVLVAVLWWLSRRG